VLQSVQGQRRPGIPPRRRQEIDQGSRASVDSQAWARVSPSTLVEAGNHPAYGTGSPPYEQADHHPAYCTNAASFNPAGSLQPHALDAPGFNSAHQVHASNATQFTQSGDFETHRPNLEYGNDSRNYTANEAFPARFPSRTPTNHMVDMIPQPIGQRLVGRMYASQRGYISPLLSSQMEGPPERQRYAAPNEYISPPIPGQESYTDAGGFEGMDLLEPWRPHEDLTDEVGGFSAGERQSPPPGQFQPLHDALGHLTPHEAAGLNGFPRGDPRNPLPEQHQLAQFDNHGMFAACTVGDYITLVQTLDSSNIVRPANLIIEGNLPFMEAYARGSSSTVPVEHSRSSDERERAPRKDAEPAATVSEVEEVMTQSEELGQPFSAEAVTADPDVEPNGSMAALGQRTSAGIWETTVHDEQSSVAATLGQRQRVGHDTGESSADQVGSTEEGGGDEEWNDGLGEFPRTPPQWNPEWDQPHRLPHSSPLARSATDEELGRLVKEYEDQAGMRARGW
jgi:hypothetical protein